MAMVDVDDSWVFPTVVNRPATTDAAMNPRRDAAGRHQ